MTNLFQPPLSRTITLLMASALWLVVGCGSGGGETTTVAGEVTIGGKPLPEDAKGTVSFAPVNDIEAEPVVAQIANSRYEASNVPVGAVRATFNIYREGPPKVSQRTGQEYREETSLVPPQHAAGHEVNIDAANENLDFNL